MNSGLAASKGYTASDIEVLEGLEAVRKRPAMYVGGTDARALHHLVAELLDNAMDEVIAGFADRIHVELGEDGAVRVRDNGRGIPVDPHPRFPDRSALEILLTILHSGGKFNDKVYATSGGLHGVGLSVVNALSVWTEVTVERDGGRFRQRFARGRPETPLQRIGNSRTRGTEVAFLPDPEIFHAAHFHEETLLRMCRAKAYLNRGVVIHLHLAPSERKLEFRFPNGLSDYLKEAIQDRDPVSPDLFTGVGEGGGGPTRRFEWAVAWSREEEIEIASYCNAVPTPSGGTHETGLRSALVRAFREYAEARDLLPKGMALVPEDVLSGVVGALSVFVVQPEFSGQTKERLSTPEVGRVVEAVVKDHLDHWLHGSPQRAALLLEAAVERARERISRRKEPAVKRKTVTTRLTLPGKLTDCSSTDLLRTELFIVEGDSAGGSAKQARDRHFQAILPLRGKILNVEQAAMEKFDANTEIQSLVTALGAGSGRSFDIRGLRYGKVIIMTDADVDGAHIASLLLTFFYRFMPGLIREGRLYLGCPPLYRLTQGSESIYALDDAEKERLLKRMSRKRTQVEISRFKGLGEMDPRQLRETTMDPASRRLLRVRVDEEGPTQLAFERLMGKKPAERFRFIQERAVFSREELDL